MGSDIGDSPWAPKLRFIMGDIKDAHDHPAFFAPLAPYPNSLLVLHTKLEMTPDAVYMRLTLPSCFFRCQDLEHVYASPAMRCLENDFRVNADLLAYTSERRS